MGSIGFRRVRILEVLLIYDAMQDKPFLDLTITQEKETEKSKSNSQPHKKEKIVAQT